MSKIYKIHVPASTANIGPGFDVCGISLSLELLVTVTIPDTSLIPTLSSTSSSIPSSTSSPLTIPASTNPSSPDYSSSPSTNPSSTNYSPPTLTYTGLSSTTVPLSPYKNLITRVSLYVLHSHHLTFPPNIKLNIHNSIPFGRGLGSSGAAVIAGVLLGDLLGNLNLSIQRKLDYALMVERHPDNVTAALIGGFIGSYLKEIKSDDGMDFKEIPLAEVLPEYPENVEILGEDWGKNVPLPPKNIGNWVKWNWLKEIKMVVVIPEFQVATAKARGVLPDKYDRKDVIFNLQRLAVLITALTTSPLNPELIYEAMKDKLHQPYRMALIPGLTEILTSLSPTTHPGLLGICLSGAGPTILALATHNFDLIAESIKEVFKKEGVKADHEVLSVDTRGSWVEEV
ncbi:homoserine kinase [Tremella mesenterica]|uniref:Homoserine kinase n=1 Tax=Tremella mesenterica TaxID=5217 RepID=A0A4Q1BI55_TREME|nr:homoserine kinase [Tremella mesenterica]